MGGTSPPVIAAHSHVEQTDARHVDVAALRLSRTLKGSRLPQLPAIADDGEGHRSVGHPSRTHADAIVGGNYGMEASEFAIQLIPGERVAEALLPRMHRQTLFRDDSLDDDSSVTVAGIVPEITVLPERAMAD
jgi:hypothetical protein